MSLSKDLLFLILQFCHEENLEKTAHMLEQEAGLFFDMNYFEELVLSGSWDEAESYLSGFTKIEEDKYSIKIYFEIRKQKFLEALDQHDRARALDILIKDLKVFAPLNQELYNELTLLITFEDFREHSSLSLFGDTMSARKRMMSELKNIFGAYPPFQGKLQFPQINNSRLRRLVNQSLNWQHILCSHPQPNPDIKTLFNDHQCPQSNHPFGQLIEDNASALESRSVLLSSSSDKGASDLSTLNQSMISDGAVNLGSETNSDTTLKGIKKSGNVSKTSSTESSDEVDSPITLPIQNSTSSFKIPDDLPQTVGCLLNEDSPPASMDFHPVQHTFLLVGTSVGDVGLWEVISGEKLFSSNFSVWKIKTISMTFLVALLKDPHVSVNRILWSPDGSLFGVAYSKHLVHIYSYHGGSNIRKQLEIDAHVGGVNDLAFSQPTTQLLVITCGDDKLVQVWDVTTGAKQYTFEGHEAPVYSVCANAKENIHFLFSTSTNGEIKAWLYDNLGSRIAYNAPKNCAIRMAYNSGATRLFSCGTNQDGESIIVEWNESEGYVKRAYQGLCNYSLDVVQCDISKNQFLAAGDDHLVKIWDIDHTELLTTIDADGNLPATPYVCFNKKGMFLAVSANHNGIKILANSYGLQLLQTSGCCSVKFSAGPVRKLAINPVPPAAGAGVKDGGVCRDGDAHNSEDNKRKSLVEPDGISEEVNLIPEMQNFSEINEPSRCQSLRLPSELKKDEISKLIYTNAGNAILALAANGTHLVWKWPHNEGYSSGKATTKFIPQLWKPRNGLIMVNDLIDKNVADDSSCFSLSKNDYYVVSASGRRISLFNIMTFKTMKTFIPPPPLGVSCTAFIPTCIAFYPQDNNIIVIGMDDSTILVYNIRKDEVIRKLTGHSTRITGLAFSNALNILVSSGNNAQIIVWDSDQWEKKHSRWLQAPLERLPLASSNTHVQFHQDQMHFLAVHETHIAIYETTNLDCVNQWVIGDLSARISHATFSCDSQLVYASILDGTVLVFGASDLHLRTKIYRTAYLPSDISSNVHPSIIAAHPQKPNQFALGLTDGEVVLVEPAESEGKWGVLSSVGNTGRHA